MSLPSLQKIHWSKVILIGGLGGLKLRSIGLVTLKRHEGYFARPYPPTDKACGIFSATPAAWPWEWAGNSLILMGEVSLNQ